MITFILNNDKVSTGIASGSSLLDFIRYEKGLTGTKIGCREGDCGACTVLMGTYENGTTSYRSVVSCLTPLINAHGKHIVTVEGLQMENLTPVQEAIVNHGATQCGFCTPGFVMSLTACSLSPVKTTVESAIASVSGNICRCTGYKSIEKAAEAIAVLLRDKDINDPVWWLVQQKHLPDWFLTIGLRLVEILRSDPRPESGHFLIAGATDLMVQKGEILSGAEVLSLENREELRGIRISNGKCHIGAATTFSELADSPDLGNFIPEISSYLKLVGSEPVRNMATVAGNIVNASPIGDITVMLLALNARLTVGGPDGERNVMLKDFFQGYKKTDLGAGEIIKRISFDYRHEPALFSFEKVSKRKHLDIASVNSALHISMDGDKIKDCLVSAGGVSPIPLLLKKTSLFFRGKTLTPDIIMKASIIMQDEISPISDVRGSAEYKRLLLRQLLVTHFIKLFPQSMNFSIDVL